jgi:hypothetical protein
MIFISVYDKEFRKEYKISKNYLLSKANMR